MSSVTTSSPHVWPVLQLVREHSHDAARTLAAAFWNDPVYVHILPDSRQRQRTMLTLQKVMVDYCMVQGVVYGTPECTGVACWLPPAGENRQPLRDLQTAGMFLWAFSCLPFGCLVRSLRLFGKIDALHRAAIAEPHWYLWALGVKPSAQGRGIGGAVVQPVLQRADQSGLACYLETANRRNLPFYQRLGFELLGEHVDHASGVTIWTMVRPAQQRP